MPPKLKLQVRALALSVCQLPVDLEIPNWVLASRLYSLMRTNSELSVVCESAFVPPQFKNEPGWLAIEAEGPFPFDLTGILAAIIQPLALAAIPIFALSTFDTDYVLIKKHDLDNAVEILRSCGHELSFEELYSDRSQR